MVQERTQRFAPDVVHFHNTFPLVSPAAFRAARGSGAAVVASLHNYRLVCPSADLFRDGQECTDCLGRRIPWPGVQHGCYRDSRVQTAVVASMLGFHNLRRSWSRDVDLFLTPSQATAQLLQSGVPSDRLRVKPNFITDDVDPPPPGAARSGFLFVGRLTVEKGILVLLEAWRRHAPGELTIVGDGPLRSAVEEAARDLPLIQVAGETDRAGVMRAMGDAAALIVPSVWQEPFGLVVIEAFASETPVIAARSGALPELIEHERSGLLYEATDPDALGTAVARAVEDPELMLQLGRHARQVYQSRYSAATNYDLLIEAYEEALDRRRGTSRP